MHKRLIKQCNLVQRFLPIYSSSCMICALSEQLAGVTCKSTLINLTNELRTTLDLICSLEAILKYFYVFGFPDYIYVNVVQFHQSYGLFQSSAKLRHLILLSTIKHSHMFFTTLFQIGTNVISIWKPVKFRSVDWFLYDGKNICR